MQKLPYPILIPYYDGFKGKITKASENSKYTFKTYGTFETIPNTNKIKITSLPINVWTSKLTDNCKGYFSDLEDIGKKNDKKNEKKKKINKFNEPILINHKNLGGANYINIEVEFTKIKFLEYLRDGMEQIYDDLHLTSIINTSNLVIHQVDDNNKDVFNKFNNANDIIIEFYNIRYDIYVKRKKKYLNILNNEINILKEKLRFMILYKEKKIIIQDKTNNEIEEQLIKYNFKKLSKNNKEPSFDYLDFKVSQLSKENFEKLDKLCKDKIIKRDEYQKMTIEEIWINELNELINELNIFYKDKRNMENEINNKNFNNRRRNIHL